MKPVCKVCGSDTHYFITKGSEVSCNENTGGYDVVYHQCDNCGLVFTIDFDHWTKQDFSEKIYNSEYIKYDPDYVSARPNANAPFVVSLLSGRGLDYGGGNGLLAKIVRRSGKDMKSWDPMNNLPRPSGKFKTITAFEVFEHVPSPIEMLEDILSFLSKDGTIYFSTLTSGAEWYIAPRNGHITIHTNKSLEILGNIYGLQYTNINRGFHKYANH